MATNVIQNQAAVRPLPLPVSRSYDGFNASATLFVLSAVVGCLIAGANLALCVLTLQLEVGVVIMVIALVFLMVSMIVKGFVHLAINVARDIENMTEREAVHTRLLAAVANKAVE